MRNVNTISCWKFAYLVKCAG